MATKRRRKLTTKQAAHTNAVLTSCEPQAGYKLFEALRNFIDTKMTLAAKQQQNSSFPPPVYGGASLEHLAESAVNTALLSACNNLAEGR